MKLFIKQKVFSLKDRFSVVDENGCDRYYVEGDLFSIGKKLHVYDQTGAEVLFLRQKVLSLLPRFFIYSGGRELCQIHQLFAIRPKYEIIGPNWTITGSFWEHDYNIIDERGFSIVSVHKKWMSWGDSYEVDIADERNALTALGAVLVIDAVISAQSAAAASYSSSDN